MQDTKTVLTAIQKCGTEGKPLERIYRQMFNRDLYLTAYGKIYRNQGAMTPGTTGDTVDGMSLARIEAIIDLMRNERYRWTPTRRTYIEKKGSTKKRPLGIPTWTDKLVQEVIRMILEAYYEPRFSDHSHGFRPNRGCGTALQEIGRIWSGTTWFIEGDIKGCFDHIDHDILCETLAIDIHDGRFLNLIRGALAAGFVEDWEYKPTLSGTPQGGIISPILANIYLDRLDTFVEHVLIPAYTRGEKRRENPAYRRVRQRAYTARKHGDWEKARQERKVQRTLPSLDTHDPEYRRLRYVRYADDYLLGFAGPRQEAEEIKRLLEVFLRDHLQLEQSEEKTFVTHGRTQAAQFLGYEVSVYDDNTRIRLGRRTLPGGIRLRIPQGVVHDRCKPFLRKGKPQHQPQMLNDSDYDIVTRFQAEYRGVVNYYRLATNLSAFSTLGWAMNGSLMKTMAAKHKTSVKKVMKSHRVQLTTPDGPRTAYRWNVKREGKEPLVATWGGVSLKRESAAVIRDPWTGPPPTHWGGKHAQIVERLLADTCELCGAIGSVEVHHVRHLHDLYKKGRNEKPLWMQIMATRQRKTLVVCLDCHHRIHAGQQIPTRRTFADSGEPDAVKMASPVRGGGRWKSTSGGDSMRQLASGLPYFNERLAGEVACRRYAAQHWTQQSASGRIQLTPGGTQ